MYAEVLLRIARAIGRPVDLAIGLEVVRVPRISRRLDEIAAEPGLQRNQPTNTTSAIILSAVVLLSAILGVGVVDVVAQSPRGPEREPSRSVQANSRAAANSIDGSVDEQQPTDTEKRALAAIEKVVGGNFRVNKKGAAIEAFLGDHELTADLLEHLAKIRSLRSLYLNRSKIADDELRHLTELANLRRLYLGETAVGDAGLEHLKGLTNLEYLHLGDTKVTGAGTEHLRGLTNLKILHLFHTRVDDGGLADLQGLSKLQLVSLSPTTVTDEGVKKLQQALPKLVIQGKPKWIVDHPDSAKELSVSIAVPKRDSLRVIDLRQPDAYFNVVVTNLSKRSLRLWETWNSWGYFNLSFDVLDDKGNVVNSVVKRPRVWTRNGATWVTIKPGEHFILEVDFDPDIWIWGGDIGDSRPVYLPFLSVMGAKPEFKLKLRAVFRILPDWETNENNVWTGTVRSTPDTFSVRHTPRLVNSDSDSNPQDPRMTEAMAIAIAAREMSRKFPDSFERCKPYRARLADGVWQVYGTVPGGGPGGTPEAHVRDSDGSVLKTFHSQ